MLKLFLAFPVAEFYKKEITELQKQNSFPDIRWTVFENLHITLFFIGLAEEKNLTEIISELKTLFNSAEKFQLTFEKISVEGKPSKQQMIWLKFQRSEPFAILNDAIYHAVKKFMTAVPLNKPPVPHVTLARIKSSVGFEKEKINFTIGLPLLNQLDIEHAELWQSVQTKEGVKYVSLEKFSFRY